MAFPEVKAYDPDEFVKRRNPRFQARKLTSMAMSQLMVAMMLLLFQMQRPWFGYTYLNLAMVALMFVTWNGIRTSKVRS